MLVSVLYHRRNHYQSLGQDANGRWWHNNGCGVLRNMGHDFFTAHKAARLEGKRPRLFFYVATRIESAE